MRLLVDENLSESLIPRLPPAFAGSQHVRAIAGEGARDREVWRLARERGLVILTLDSDFEKLSILLGPPPKVIWLAMHNPGTSEVAGVLGSKAGLIERFVADPDVGFLALRG